MNRRDNIDSRSTASAVVDYVLHEKYVDVGCRKHDASGNHKSRVSLLALFGVKRSSGLAFRFQNKQNARK